MSEKEKRIGVYICHCGGNISDYVDAEKVLAEIKLEPGVTVAKTSLFSCSDASQQEIVRDIQEQHLDGLVVASCSPKLHQLTFRNAARRAGLNPFQYVQVNIREQCSWAHSDDPAGASCKAAGLVRGGIEKAIRQEPLEPIRVTSVRKVLIIGGGVAGMRAAIAMADLGVAVFLVEREADWGGMVGRLGALYPDGRSGSEIVESLQLEIQKRSGITVFKSAELVEKSGHIGDFACRIRVAAGDGRQEQIELNVGAIIVATGFTPYEPRPGEFGRGDPGVVTLPEFERLVRQPGEKLVHQGREVRSIAFIYCVGSRQNAGIQEDSRQNGDVQGESRQNDGPHRYCSRTCCNAAVHTSLQAQKRFSGLRSFHLYRDLRTYGKFETLYRQASEAGALFLRFPDAEPPKVMSDAGGLQVITRDLLTGGMELALTVDLVVLATGMQARENDDLTRILKLPRGLDGFYNEIHAKLRPVETVIDGVYVTGCCQGPKNAGESAASSLAAVAKAASLLVKGYVDLQPFVAYVMGDRCTWCGECEKACPYSAITRISYGDKEVAKVEEVLCKGCGACVPVCPLDATQLKGSTDEQVEAMIVAMAREGSHAG